MLGKLDNEQSFKLAEACFKWRWAAEGAPDSSEEATYERSETKPSFALLGPSLVLPWPPYVQCKMCSFNFNLHLHIV